MIWTVQSEVLRRGLNKPEMRLSRKRLGEFTLVRMVGGQRIVAIKQQRTKLLLGPGQALRPDHDEGVLIVHQMRPEWLQLVFPVFFRIAAMGGRLPISLRKRHLHELPAERKGLRQAGDDAQAMLLDGCQRLGRHRRRIRDDHCLFRHEPLEIRRVLKKIPVPRFVVLVAVHSLAVDGDPILGGGQSVFELLQVRPMVLAVSIGQDKRRVFVLVGVFAVDQN